jgi:hypothetical protein
MSSSASVTTPPPPRGGITNSYDAAIKRFGSRKQAAIKATLIKWSKDALGREVVRNINPLERFLPPESMTRLLSVIYNARSKGLDELAILYQAECYKTENTLAGGSITIAKPKIIGRAVEKQAFVNYLYEKQRHCFRTRAIAKDFVQRLIAGDTMSKAESSVLMSEFSAWVTWNDISSDLDPFAFARSSNLAEMVRACLGLDPENRMKGKPILLLIYQSHAALELCRPTIADAGLYRFFEPPPIGVDAHGLTKAWPPGMGKSISTPTPRPEAIHAPQLFSNLSSLQQLL